MKKVLPFLVPALLLFYFLFNQGDHHTKKITFYSKSLKKEMKVNIYLPKGYSTEKSILFSIYFTGRTEMRTAL